MEYLVAKISGKHSPEIYSNKGSQFQFIVPILILIFLLVFLSNSKAVNYYWVGGAGSWSDNKHWSLSSGGTPCACTVPTSIDNVFFDANSFTSINNIVTVNAVNPVCHDMNWTGVLFTPTFTGSNTLRIYGSLTLTSAMIWSYTGWITFEAITSGKTITSAGKTFSTITFQGIGGGWTLMDSLSVAGPLGLTSGSLNTNNHKVNCRQFNCSGYARSLSLGSSVFTINYTAATSYILNMSSENLIFNAGTSTLIIYGLPATDITSVKFTGIEPLTFYNIKTANSSGFCSPLPDFNWDIITKTTIHKLTISGNQFHLLNNISNTKILIDSLLVMGDCFKTIDDSYQLKINDIVCSQNVSLFLNVDQDDTIKNILFNGDECTINGNNAKFHKVILNRNSYINGNNTFDSLALAPGYLYELASFKTQTIVNSFSAEGSCTGNILIKASANGNQTTLFKAGGIVSSNHLVLQDINATGGATFNADNSIDHGNNTGWNINPSSPKNFFWVGDTGDWNAPNHWSESSGGTGGTCIPSPIDNVFFDVNSFSSTNQKVTINVEHALCNSMDWTGATFSPTFTGDNSRNFHIYGSLKLISDMIWDFSGFTFFESNTPGKTITSAGNAFQNHVFFQGLGGSWSLSDGFQTTKNLYLSYGTLNTNNQSVYCKTFSSENSGSRGLILGKSVINCNSPLYDYNFRLTSDNLAFNAGTSTIKLSGINTNLYPVVIKGSQPLDFFNIENTNNNNCTSDAYSCWDVRTKVTIHKLTLFNKQLRLVKNGSFNNVKISIDSLLIMGECDKVFDTIYNLKIQDIVGSQNASLVLNADHQDTIRIPSGTLFSMDSYALLMATMQISTKRSSTVMVVSMAIILSTASLLLRVLSIISIQERLKQSTTIFQP